MSLNALTELGLDNEQQLARLRRALLLKRGFQLIFLEISHASLQRGVLQRLGAWSGVDGVPELQVVEVRAGDDPVAALQGVAQGVILVGIDRIREAGPRDVHPSGAGAGDRVERSMVALNWYRDQLPALVPGPLVIVLSPDGLRRLFVHAPDLFAWRAHTTRVTASGLLDHQIQPPPDPQAALEEKEWLERMIVAVESASGGPLGRALPDWLIRLGEIEAREGGPWERRFQRAEELAVGRRDVLFRLELARARRALEEERYEDAERHEGKAAEQVTDAMDVGQAWELTPGPGAVRQPGRISHDLVFAELRAVRAERLLRVGEIDRAAPVAEAALTAARASGDLSRVIAALAILGAIARQRGDQREASGRFGELLEVARMARNPVVERFAQARLDELEGETDAPLVSAGVAAAAVGPGAGADEDDNDGELAALESELLGLDVSGDALERLEVLDRLARAYRRQGRHWDAGLCHARTVWESPEPSIQARLEGWVAAELNVAGDATIEEALERALGREAPTLDDIRLVAVITALAPAPVVRALDRVQPWLDRFDDVLDARTLWLARLGLARLFGGDGRLDLVRTRARILARFAWGVSAERDQPRFLQLRERGTRDAQSNGELLASALEDLLFKIGNTRRRISPTEAPGELTLAYAMFQLSFGFARIGRRARAGELVAGAMKLLAGWQRDPVHAWLISAFTARIDQSTTASPSWGSPELTRARMALDRMERYKVDRLREASRILEPADYVDAIEGFSKAQQDIRGPEFVAIDMLSNPELRLQAIERLIEQARSASRERERLAAGLLDVIRELPEPQAAPLLERTLPLISELAVQRRAPLCAKALIVASQFRRLEWIPSLLASLGHAIRESKEADLERVLGHSLRALRHVGLRKEVAALLAEAEHAVPGARLNARLALAAGMAFLGEFERARTIFESAHEVLESAQALQWRLNKWQMDLIRSLTTAYSYAPLLIALDGIERIERLLPNIADGGGLSTNSHFSLYVLRFIDSLVVALTSDDLVLGESGRRFSSDDEHLIRRRLRRDLASLGQ